MLSLSFFLSAEQNAFPFILACFMFMVADLLKQKTPKEDMEKTDAREEKILVLVRLRPPNQKEIAANEPTEDWECLNDTTILYRRNTLRQSSNFPSAYSFGNYRAYTALHPSLFYIYIRFSNEIGSSPPDYEKHPTFHHNNEIHQHHWI